VVAYQATPPEGASWGQEVSISTALNAINAESEEEHEFEEQAAKPVRCCFKAKKRNRAGWDDSFLELVLAQL
jgi:hypothetical protein